MVRIPTFQGTATPSTATPSLIGTDAFTGPAKAAGAFGQQLQSVGKQFQKLRELNEITGATISFNQRMQDLANEVDQDETFDDFGVKYEPDAKKILSEELGKISNPLAQQRFALQGEGQVLSSLSQFRTKGRARQINAQDALFEDYLRGTKDQLFNTFGEQRQRLFDQVSERFNEMIVTGVRDGKQARGHFQSYFDTVNKEQFNSDLQNNLIVAEQRLADNEYGFTKQETEEARTDVNNMTAKFEKEAILKQKKAQENTAITETLKAFNGQGDLVELDKQLDSGQMELSDYLRVRKTIVGDGKKAVFNPEVYNELDDEMERLLAVEFTEKGDPISRAKRNLADGITIEDLAKFRIKISEKVNDKTIRPQDGEDFLRLINGHYNELLTDEAEESIERGINKKQEGGFFNFGGWFFNGRKWAIDNADDVINARRRIAQELHRTIREKGNPTAEDMDNALDRGIQGELDIQNPNRQGKKIGDRKTSPAGTFILDHFDEATGEPKYLLQ